MIPRDVSSTPGIDRPRCKWVISLINDFSFLSSHKYPSSYKRGCCSGFGWWGAYRQEFACSTKFSSLSLQRVVLVGAIFILFLWEHQAFVEGS